MPRRKTKKQTPKKVAVRKKPAPKKEKQAVKAARKITAPRAEKEEVKKMAKSTTAKAPVQPDPPAVARAAKALKAKAAGSTGWKETKYGVTKAAVSCYNCAWYQPFYGPGFQPEGGNHNGGNGGEVRNNNNNQINPEAASQFGWCRGDSVDQENFNAWIPGQPSGYIQNTDYIIGPRTMNEVIIRDCTEFWCGMWVRTPNPYPYPPNYLTLPPPWIPNGPVATEEPE